MIVLKWWNNRWFNCCWLTLIQRRYIICEIYIPVCLNVKRIKEGTDKYSSVWVWGSGKLGTSTLAAQRRMGQGWRSLRAGQDFRWLRKASALSVRSSMGRGREWSSSDLFGRQLEASHSAEVHGKGHSSSLRLVEFHAFLLLSKTRPPKAQIGPFVHYKLSGENPGSPQQLKNHCHWFSLLESLVQLSLLPGCTALC